MSERIYMFIRTDNDNNCVYVLQKGSDSEEELEEESPFEASPPPREKTTGRRAASKVIIFLKQIISNPFNENY